MQILEIPTHILRIRKFALQCLHVCTCKIYVCVMKFTNNVSNFVSAVMDNLEAGLKQVNLTDVHKIQNGFALVIVNQSFRYHRDRKGARADRKNIETFCGKAGFTVNKITDLQLKQTSGLKFKSNGDLKTDNLTRNEMDNLFKTISKGNFESYDAFICFISSHGSEGGILGTDGRTISVEYIVDQFKASDECPSLVNKPKLFFTQNCRGVLKNSGVNVKLDDDNNDESETENDEETENDDGTENDDATGDRDTSDDDDETDVEKIPMTIPTTADVLVAYSTVNRYESLRNTKKGSWFITVLTQTLETKAKNMDLTHMLATVNKEVAEMRSKKGKKQMPCFTSTLRKAVYFKMIETHSPVPESEGSHTASDPSDLNYA